VRQTTSLDLDDFNLIVAFAGCSLDEKPGSNWVQEAGGLPDFICRIARAIKRTGKTTSQAIAIAVARVKKWAAGGDDVKADTRAKAAKALAEWEKLKAKSGAKNVVKTSAVDTVLNRAPRTDALDQVLALAAQKPYGNVTYADPGYRDNKKRYPIDTADHVRAAWSYINQASNQRGYTPAQLAAIKSRIKAAAKKFNIDISDD